MAKLPEHLFIDGDGALYDTRPAGWIPLPPLRKFYSGQWNGGRIDSAEQFKAALRAGAFTDLGGYPLYFLMSDGDALSYDAARANLRPIFEALENQRKTGCRSDCWLPVAVDVNWEDDDLTCCHTNRRIPSAYGDNAEEDTETPHTDPFN